MHRRPCERLEHEHVQRPFDQWQRVRHNASRECPQTLRTMRGYAHGVNDEYELREDAAASLSRSHHARRREDPRRPTRPLDRSRPRAREILGILPNVRDVENRHLAVGPEHTNDLLDRPATVLTSLRVVDRETRHHGIERAGREWQIAHVAVVDLEALRHTLGCSISEGRVVTIAPLVYVG